MLRGSRARKSSTPNMRREGAKREKPTFQGPAAAKAQGGARQGISPGVPEPKPSGLIPASFSGAAFWIQASCLLGGLVLFSWENWVPLQPSPHHLHKEFLPVRPSGAMGWELSRSVILGP